MAKTRTMVEIDKDYKACRKYVDEHPTVASLKEIAEAIGLSENQVNTSFSRHPRVFNNIKKLIEKNQEILKEQKQAEAEAKRKATREASESKKKAKAETRAKKKADETKKYFVLDASITGIENILDTLHNICVDNDKIVLTSITIKELEKMQDFHDTDGKDARKILSMAADDSEHFECALIDETVGTHDDCIVNYCIENKDKVILMTSDKTMELKARTYGVKTNFFKQPLKTQFKSTPTPIGKVSTLYETRRIGGKLIVCDFDNCFKSIRVISGGAEYDSGSVELKVGDDIYIAAQKRNHIIFIHYKVISLALTNNCKLIYSRRIYDVSGINDLPEANYKSFVRDFKRKVNF